VAERGYEDGKEKAMDAIGRFPNHPSAASCLAYIYGAQSEQDSLVWALERAAAGDSSLTQVWGQLGGLYLRRGDTAQAVQARLLEVETDPADAQRRMRIVRLLDELGARENAVSLMEDGVTLYGGDLEFRRTLVRMCLQYEMWTCAQENLGALYALDPTLAGDTAFFFQMIGLAQATSDPETAIWWTEEAVRQVDSLVDEAWRLADQQRQAAERMEEVHLSLRLSSAATLLNIGRRDSALSVYLGIYRESAEHWRAGIAAAQLMTQDQSLGTRPLTRSDSLALRTADSLLLSIAQAVITPEVWDQVGMVYLDVGSRLVRDRGQALVASRWLDKALAHDPSDTNEARGNAMLALALAYLVEETDLRLRTEPSCELVLEEQSLIERALSAAETAGEEYAELMEGLAAGLQEYLSLIPQLSQAIGCEVPQL
jgi:tetratricopeptide (TPR) repeat protein